MGGTCGCSGLDGVLLMFEGKLVYWLAMQEFSSEWIE